MVFWTVGKVKGIDMDIRKVDILYFLLVAPFFYPNSIAGTGVASIWHLWKLAAVVAGAVYIFTRIKILKKLESVVWFIILMYLMQIVATHMNSIDLTYDINTAIMTSVFLLMISLIVYEQGILGVRFLYNLLDVFVLLNFLSVVLLYGSGITKDAYDTPVYFWSTKNHIISLTLVCIMLATFLSNENIISEKRARFSIFYSVIAVFMMGSSTAIVALVVYGLFVFCYKYCIKKGKVLNLKLAMFIGIIVDFMVVIFRVQEKLGALIGALFGKDTTLTGRTDLWDQAIELIGLNYLYGKGNSYALGQYGWLTKQYWDSNQQVLEDVYFVSHNQFLEILVNGGMICLIPFILAFLSMGRSVHKIKNSMYKNVIAAALLAYFIAMITDLVTPYEPLYVFMIVASYMYQNENFEEGVSDYE